MKRIILPVSYILILLAGIVIGRMLFTPEPATQIVRQNANPPRPMAQDKPPIPAEILKTETVDVETILTGASIFQQQSLAYRMAGLSDVPQLMAAMDYFLQFDDHFFNSNIVFIFLERLIEIDPDLAVSYVDGAPMDREKRRSMRASVITTWARYEPNLALGYLATLTSREQAQIGHRLLIDPVFLASGFDEELVQILGPQGEEMRFRRRLQMTDPATAFEEALLNRGQMRNILTPIVQRWADEDLESVLARVQAMPPSADRQQLLGSIVQRVAENNAFQAYEYFNSLVENDMQLKGQVISMMMIQDAYQGRTYLDEFIDQHGADYSISGAITSWARADPNAALAYIEESPDRISDQLAMQLLPQLINTHPDRAIQWARESDSSQIKQMMYSLLPQVNRPLAESLLNEVDDESSKVLLSQLAQARMRSNRQTAFDWLQQYDDHPGYEDAMRDVLFQLSHEDPAGAAEYAADYVGSEAYTSVFSQIARRWATTSQDEAIDWAVSLRDGPGRSQALQGLAFTLSQTDTDKALSILREFRSDTDDHMILPIAAQLMVQGVSESQILRALDMSREEYRRRLEEMRTGIIRRN